jgi:hypothetical protein
LRDGRRGSSSRWARLHSERILGFVVMAPARETLLGVVDAASDAKRQGWLDRMRDDGRRLT